MTLSQESPLSSRYPLTPSSSQNHSTNPGIQHVHFPQSEPVPFALSSESHTLIPHITTPADVPPRPSTPSKLKKKRSNLKDGYESEGSTLGDVKRKKDKKDKKGRKDKLKDVPLVPALPTHAEPPAPTVIPSESIGLKKSGKGGAAPSPEAWGYETDASRKEKKKKWGKKKIEEDDKEVKKSKSFFKLGKKSSKGDLRTEISPFSASEPVPNARPLPIAERYATTLNKSTGAPMIALGSNGPQATTTGSRPVGLGIDLDLGLTGEMFSTASPPSRTRDALSPPPMESRSMLSQTSTAASMPQQLYPNPAPPVSYPSPPVASRSNSTSTEQSTGAGRTSVATSVSTSQSNVPTSPVSLPPILSRQASNPAITRPSTATSASSGNAVPSPLPSPMLPGGMPQTPSKRRILPFFNGTPTRNSSSSGDSQARDRERKREKEDKKREKERIREEKEREKERLREEKEKMKTKHKPMISLPLTRAGQDVPETFPIPPPSATSMSSVQSSVQSNVSSMPQRTVRPTSPIMETSHPPVSGSQFQTQQNALSRRASQTQTHTLGLSRQLSLTTLRSDAAFPIGHVTPIPMDRSPSPVSTTFPRSKKRRSTQLSPLPSPPNVFVHHDIPPATPPPMTPLPSVPNGDSASSSLQPGHFIGNGSSGSSVGELTVNVGIAVTTGSPLPSPLLMTSSHGDSNSVNGNGSADGRPPPPTSFNHSSAAAGSALRAKVRRQLSLTGGLFTAASSSAANTGNGEASPNAGVNIPIINEPGLGRGTSIRGRESPFPVEPVNLHTPLTPSQGNSNVNLSVNYRVASPQSGWEDTSSSNSSLLAAQRHHINRSGSGGSGGVQPEEETDEDFMDGVREVISRFRESRIDDGSKKKLDDNVIARRGSFEAFAKASNGGGVSPGRRVEAPQPILSSGLTVPSGGDGRVRSERYDSFALEEYYARPDDYAPGMNGYDDREYGDEGEYGYEEDASYYPDDELPRNSRKRRSTLYASDEDSSAHGHSSGGNNGAGGKSRNSRWSGSIYSRASFMDTERSGETRQRFLQHVEEMLNERGERVPAVPPVPKLPEEFVAESRRVASEKAKREYEEFELKKTVGTGARKVFPAGTGR